MQRLLVAALIVIGVSGCRSNPYCLNCKDSGNGVISATEDLATAPDLTGGGPGNLPDMTGMLNGMCTPTNGGVEVCDGLDNNCDGIIDNVDPSKLIGDGNNCGACGKVCTYLHAGGVCVGGFDAGMPTCAMGACQPGYVDLNKDPSDGCEYTCTKTADPTEICDGKDNNCDGQVDEGFTATWSDAAHQHPLYDNDIKDCGQCGVVCSLGPGTVMACNGTGTGGRGQCAVAGCFNGLDGNGNHVTYKHNPANGMISATGCEYECPFPSVETGTDCNSNACTFPAETCNGKDDDCNFFVDDGAAQPAMNTRCPDGAPGKLCSDGLPPGSSGQCVGQCAAGSLVCNNGALVCGGSVGPSVETCDQVDNDCNGKIDEPYTATWQANGTPKYDSDPNHCGGCVTPPFPGVACYTTTMVNAVLGCHLTAPAATAGTCYVIACNAGYAYVPKTGTVAGTCNTPAPGPENPNGATQGVGCFYKCNPPTQGPETCDGLDNDCNGCVDDGLTKPAYFCATKGVCGAPGVQPLPINCKGKSGWECDYSAVPGISLDGTGNLTTNELQCDGEDNNCNGSCDENFPNVAIVTNPTGPIAGTTCNNPHAAHTCTTGLGKCQATSSYVCSNSGGGTVYNDTSSCTVVPATTPSPELCNGIDDNCNGLVDEATDVSAALPGVHDPVVLVNVPMAPGSINCTDPLLPNGTDPCQAHQVYMYQYEASRPDASGTSAGSLNTRACSNKGTLPWSNVTLAQAQAACAAIKDPTTGKSSIGRLCTAWEWQSGCAGTPPPSGSVHWSIDANGAAPGSYTTNTYITGVCNDANETDERCTSSSQCIGSGGCNANGVCACTKNADCNAGFTCDTVNSKCTGSGVWPTGSKGTNTSNTCFTPYADAKGNNAGAYDLTGNLGEWTQTTVSTATGTNATISAFSNGVQTITGLTSGVYNTDVGAQLVITGAATPANNGTFIITSVTYVPATTSSTVTITNPSGTATDANKVAWSLIYNKERGGSFTSPDSTTAGGGVCEFDFDIQKATFFNTDLGFRCCFDVAP